MGTRRERMRVTDATTIRAAGGVAWRPAGDRVEVCLVHRPRYDDWTLPKGKLEPAEPALLAAVREVAEESDVQAVPQVRLPSVRYVSEGRPKVVDYWSMRAVGSGGFQPGTEVDDIRWLPVDEAVRLVSYPHDAVVLRAFATLPPVTGALAVVRHASAGKRATWSGPDVARPLDDTGWAQARRLAPLLALVRPVRLLAATARRCVQTLDPLAGLLDLAIEADGDFDEPRPGQDPAENALAAAGRLVHLATANDPVVVCSQGGVLPGALAQLATRPVTGASDVPGRTAVDPGADWTTPKGGGWLLAFVGDRLAAADPL
ncbi:NUDIX hydrolase [Micromonospora echinofusca]|uniref:NUDIX domain-containing protein n=1 Tax=Micromonospora echinofusca TaxID=47858 RepID=A0ABS3VY48_MICEH|nr:NUDIX hydrolase [Micromonospora echinofusca]MBO4209467.1 NUDIX domain-containing protein [Micromonospora echinofusca]